MLQDALRKALAGNATPEGSLQARTPAPEPEASAGPALPSPAASEWGQLLSDLPADASLGRFRQETALRLKAWKAAGRKREVRALKQAQDKFEKRFNKAAWKAIKQRWTELGLPDKMYRRLKGSPVDASKVAARLYTRRAESIGSEGTDTVWSWVTTGKRTR